MCSNVRGASESVHEAYGVECKTEVAGRAGSGLPIAGSGIQEFPSDAADCTQLMK